MKTIIFATSIILLVLSACGPSPEQQAALTATAQTATAAAWHRTEQTNA
jgi:maltose-binding protein MalE